ncbi:hypothetical protein FA13DRAFT_1743128 [Coprinellus micaceus]|uniref:Uncharacterized protein n=1 Tax=Coprinellus micaceus TaxID=71717 RepID=A0A4Y7SFE6_COPMI|nr:hypothetical protein FA13DRAFT_1743128 [Coprinellus micaceus]
MFGTVISCTWVHNAYVNVPPNVAVLTKGGVLRHARSLILAGTASGTPPNAADSRFGRTGNWRMRPFSRDLLPIQFRTFLCRSPGPR